MYENGRYRILSNKAVKREVDEPEKLDDALKNKLELLDKFIETNNRFAVALSGGVDSSFLLQYAARKGADVRPYFAASPFNAEDALKKAVNVANAARVRLRPVKVDTLSHREIVENPENRCYYCKKQMFKEIMYQMALESDPYPILVDGTNFSDDEKTRPGMMVLKELASNPQVIEVKSTNKNGKKATIRFCSPLRECELTKDDIRKTAKYFNMPFYKQPSNSCLATRIATGEEITDEKLRKIEFAERCLNKMGISDCRAKLFGNDLVIKIHQYDANKAVKNEEILQNRLNGMFGSVRIDMEDFR